VFGAREVRSSAAMIRRTARLRREFVYRKSLEGKERELYEKKRKIRQCLEEGKVIPTELRNAEVSLRNEIALEDASTAANGASADDEYARANERDPKVLVTTSRDPSSRLTQFVKEVKLLMPTARRINRGAQVLPDLVELCRSNDFTDLVVVHEHRGEPDGLVVSHMPFGPTAYFGLSNTVMRHDVKDQDIGTVSEANPHLVLENFTTPLGKRTANILKHLFPAPKDGKSKRVITFANDADYVSLRHHTYEMPRGAKSVALTEVGPRFEMKLYQIKLGTIDADDADVEWALRPFMRSGKKRRL
jgi:U3 small nucleolar ribonucleoprotein protein IMP4